MQTVIVLVVAACLIGTVVWAFQRYVVIPGPFAWLKGLLTFIMIAVAAYWCWSSLLTHHVFTRSLW